MVEEFNAHFFSLKAHCIGCIGLKSPIIISAYALRFLELRSKEYGGAYVERFRGVFLPSSRENYAALIDTYENR